jgi:hypothetical protein
MEVKTLLLASILVAFVGAALAGPVSLASSVDACPGDLCIINEAMKGNGPEGRPNFFCTEGCEYCCYNYCPNEHPDAMIVGDPCCQCTVASEYVSCDYR